MRPAHVIEIITPKKFILNGLWFGPAKPKRAIIFVHGLTSSAFSGSAMRDALLDVKGTAVITFNNRGFESVTSVKEKKGKETVYHTMGGTHEVFTECVDDIQGAINLVKNAGVKEIFLAGHSTGCQKSIYWASKTGGKGIQGIVLFSPISDYSSETKADTRGRLKESTALAQKLVKEGKAHELLPRTASPIMLLDAQRFLSLYTQESDEEIFCYAHDKEPKVYQSVRLPILTVFAGSDEYADVPTSKMAEWFSARSRSKRFAYAVIPKVKHSFRRGEAGITRVVKKWISG